MVAPANPLVKYLLLYAVIAIGGVAIGDAVSDAAMAEIVRQLTLIGPVLFILVQRQEEVKKDLEARQEQNRIEAEARQADLKYTIQKGLNGDLQVLIEATVRRVLDEYTRPRM